MEGIVKKACAYYRENKIARIDCIPVPTQFIPGRGLVHNRVGLVDFVGICNGKFIAFDTKERKELPLYFSHIAEHQIEYLSDVCKQGGDGYLLLHWTDGDKMWLIPFNNIEQAQNQGLKGLSENWLNTYAISIQNWRNTYPICDFLSSLKIVPKSGLF